LFGAGHCAGLVIQDRGGPIGQDIDAVGNAIRFDGTTWTTPVLVDPGGLSGVSCPSSSFCVATGYQGNAVTFDGADWAAATSISTATGLAAVSCASSTFCVAVGNYAGSVTMFDGATWTDPVLIDPDVWNFSSVSCVTAEFCVAADSAGNALQFDGTSWAAPVGVDAGGVGLIAVSCAAPAFCMALTWAGDAYQGCGCLSTAAGRAATGNLHRNVQAGKGSAQLPWQVARSRTRVGGARNGRTQRR